jgi:glyoxylase-like metal-dependent hydrolase (beta-lactamase superfamily II)
VSPHTNEVDLVPNTGWDERILLCRNGSLVTTAVVVTERHLVVVDTLLNEATASRVLELAGVYLAPPRSLLVVVTHADYDHFLGNSLFAGPGAAHPAPVIGHRLAARPPDDEARAFLEKLRAEEPEIFGDVVRVTPTVLFDGQLTIDGGDLTLELIPTPGHSPDHVSIFLPEIRTLLAGDAAELPFPFARTPESLGEMRDSLARLRALEAETVLYCHAPPDSGPDLLDANIAYFDAVEEACRPLREREIPDELEPERLVELAGLCYEDATPGAGPWLEVDPWFRTEGHAAQIRTMLTWLRG